MSRRGDLYMSDEVGLLRDTGEPVPDSPDDYLYRASDVFYEEFWLIADGLAQLNDFCVLFLRNTSDHLSGLKQDLAKLKSGKTVGDSKWGDFTGEAQLILEERIPLWEDTCDFLALANCLMLLMAFVERSLKSVVSSVADDRQEQKPRQGNNSQTVIDITSAPSAKWKGMQGESKIDAYLRMLKEEYEVDVTPSQKTVSLLSQFRRLRNAFAHGDWEKVRQQVANLHLRNAFATVADLMYSLEYAIYGPRD